MPNITDNERFVRQCTPHVCPSTLRQLKELIGSDGDGDGNPRLKNDDDLGILLLRDIPGTEPFVRRERKLKKRKNRVDDEEEKEEEEEEEEKEGRTGGNETEQRKSQRRTAKKKRRTEDGVRGNCHDLKRILKDCRGTLALQTPDDRDSKYLWHLASRPAEIFRFNEFRLALRDRLERIVSSSQQDDDDDDHDDDASEDIEAFLQHFEMDDRFTAEMEVGRGGDGVADRWIVPRNLRMRGAPMTKVHLTAVLCWKSREGEANPMNLRPCSKAGGNRGCIANEVLGDGFALYEFPPYGLLNAFVTFRCSSGGGGHRGTTNADAATATAATAATAAAAATTPRWQWPSSPKDHPGNPLCFPCRVVELQEKLLDARDHRPAVDIEHFDRFFDLTYPDVRKKYLARGSRRPVAAETGVELEVQMLLVYSFLRDLTIAENGLLVDAVCD